jgi:uncharacterized protein YnzC (UPF0291/DUF896 family)
MVSEKLKQFYIDKYEHATRCEDGIITIIDEFTGDVTEIDCQYCVKAAKAKELKTNGKG